MNSPDLADKIRAFKIKLQAEAPINHKHIWWHFSPAIVSSLMDYKSINETMNTLKVWADDFK